MIRRLLFLILIIGKYRISDGMFETLDVLIDKITNVDQTLEAATAKEGATAGDIRNAVSEITESINQMGRSIEKKIDAAIQTLITRLPLAHKIDSRFQRFWEYILRIDTLFQDMQEYLKDNSTMNEYSMRNYLTEVTSRDANALYMTLKNLHSITVVEKGGYDETLLNLISMDAQQVADTLCDVGRSPHHRLYDLYVIIITAELRAYVTLGFAYSMLTQLEGYNFMGELCKYERELENRFRGYGKELVNVLRSTPRSLRRCDPTMHVRNVSFYEFERFRQAFIVQATALVSDHSCTGLKCEKISPTKIFHGCDGFHCGKNDNSCFGTLNHCQTWAKPGDGGVAACEFPYSSPRRFLWIRDGSYRYYHKYVPSCPNGSIVNPRAHRKYYHDCPVCGCLCTDDDIESFSSHFISLRQQLAAVDDNRVVVGMKFVMRNKILHLQIQEGKLKPEGQVDSDSVQWKPLENIVYDREASIAQESYVFYVETEDGSKKPLEAGVDVAILTDSQSTINLDRLEVFSKSIITGGRFNRSPARSIQIEIKVTPFDYLTGELSNSDDDVWISAEDMKSNDEKSPWYKGGRVQHPLLGRRKNPLVKGETVSESLPNSRITIAQSSLDEDAAQTVLPLIDALEVISSPPVPLVGVDLFYKSLPEGDYGGFFSLGIITFDISDYITLASDNSENRKECQVTQKPNTGKKKQQADNEPSFESYAPSNMVITHMEELQKEMQNVEVELQKMQTEMQNMQKQIDSQNSN